MIEALTGSHNYNLAIEGSDKDYKIFIAPTFEDMYKGYYYKRNIITDTIDKDVKDIRQLPQLLWKSNLAYLELLFSKDLKLDKMHDNLYRLFDLRDEIVKMNLPQLFKSTGGMYNERMKRLGKGTDGTQHLVDKHGYNTKEAMHMKRTLEALCRFEANGFKDFAECLWYEDREKEMMLDIKNGFFSNRIFIDYISDIHDICFAPMKEKFCSQKPNEDLMEHINHLIMDVVQDEVYYELYSKSH